MSSFLKSQKNLIEDKIISISKQIKKEKRKNQYTIEFNFGSDVDVSKLKQIIKVHQQIPPLIRFDLTFRLESDISIPICIDPNLKLGALTIDPISQNYRIVRYDKLPNNYVFYFEPYERPFTPFEIVKNTLNKYHPSLGEQFELFHLRLLNKDKFSVSTEQEIQEYESSIRDSLVVYVQKKKQGKITTLTKSINSQYLQLMGINDEMFQDYVNQTGLLPWCLSNQNQYFMNLIRGMLKGAYDQVNMTMQAINYNGQEFEIKVTPKLFHLYNQEDDSYLQIMFFQQHYNNSIINQNQITQNMFDYFNLKPKIIKKDFLDDDQTKRCKYRQI